MDQNGKTVGGVKIQVFQNYGDQSGSLQADAEGRFKVALMWCVKEKLLTLVARDKDRLGWLTFNTHRDKVDKQPKFRMVLVPFFIGQRE